MAMAASLEEHYNETASWYQMSKTIPFRKYVEEYTFFKSLGDVTGMKILDLACGEGHYTRKLKARGAAKVIGLDISSSMIQLAEKQERDNPIGCTYICADASKTDKIEEFDVVAGVFYFNVADSKEMLMKLAQTAFKNLNVGGRFLVLVHVGLGCSTENLQKYDISYEKARYDGDRVNITFHNPDGVTFQIPAYYWTKQTCEDALQKVGFDAVQWMGPYLDPVLPSQYPLKYWDVFLQAKEMVVVESTKMMQ